MLDLRAIFDSAKIGWKDRGRNCSSGNVNICCPMCHEDTGFHMSVSEEDGAFYCFRRPREHSGRNLPWILRKLGMSASDADLVVSRQGRRKRPAKPPPPPVVANPAWERFKPIDADAGAYLSYIASRGFLDPLGVAQRYDLRFARMGKWAGRLLLPLTHDGVTLGWTGRAISKRDELKYLTEAGEHEGLVYLPRAARATLIVSEGPLDALKLAVAGERLPVAAVALTGKALIPERLARIQHAAGNVVRQALLGLDEDTTLGERSRMMAELKLGFRHTPLTTLRMPKPYKDAGAIPQDEAEAFLKGLATL